MALADFIQSLQEQDVVYSTPPQPSIRVIPPENQSIKIIPPESLNIEPPTPKVIKLKIKPKIKTEEPKPIQQEPINEALTQNITQNKQQNINEPIITQKSHSILKYVSNTQITENKPVITQKQKEIPKYVPQNSSNTQKVETTNNIANTTHEKKQLTDEELFTSTGTEYSKKEIWFSYYEKAKHSRKSNPIVDRMKIGRFTITPDNKVLLLPDYDIVGKDPDDVLKDKWF